MNRRTIVLASAAALIGVLYFLDAGYRSWIEEPMERLENQQSALQKELGDLQAEQVAGRRLANQLDDYAARALPYDPNLARSQYREWLLQLVERHEMQSASVNAEAPQPVEVRGRIDPRERRRIGHTIRFTLRTRTSLSRLVDFLYEYHQSAQLHKIQSFSLNPVGNGSELDLTLVIEALCLEATERSDTLSDLVRRDDSEPPRSEYELLVQRNVFARGFAESLAQIRLGAITQNRDGTLQAWFAVGSPAKTQIVGADEALDLPLHSVEVQQIESDRVQISINELSIWLKLGQTLGDVLQPNKPASEPKALDAEASDDSGELDEEKEISVIPSSPPASLLGTSQGAQP